MAFRIMFVDDEPDVLKTFKTLIQPLGCEVVTLADSQEAAQRINKEKFDCIFLDALMPHPDGFELAELVRNSPSNFRTPIVMLTGYDDAEAMRKGFRAGVTSFIGKPVTQSRLAALLGSMRGVMLREKRRYTRTPFIAVVTCRSDNRTFKSKSINISETGMLLEDSNQVAIGLEVDLEFLMPQAQSPFKLRAKIVRKQSPNRMAVHFVALKTIELQSIQQYLSAVIPD